MAAGVGGRADNLFEEDADPRIARGKRGASPPQTADTTTKPATPQARGERGKTPVILNGGEGKGDNQDSVYNCKKGKPKRIYICNTTSGDRTRTRPAAEADAPQPKPTNPPRSRSRRPAAEASVHPPQPPEAKRPPRRGGRGERREGARRAKRARQGAAARQGAGAGAGARGRKRTRNPVTSALGGVGAPEGRCEARNPRSTRPEGERPKNKRKPKGS